MAEFVPFDEDYSFDKTVLTEEFPKYIQASVDHWILSVLRNKGLASGDVRLGVLSETFTLPLNRVLRTDFGKRSSLFFEQLHTNDRLCRNVISFLLQTFATVPQGHQLDQILVDTSSAYAVEFSKTTKETEAHGIRVLAVDMKLVYRVAPIVKKQADALITHDQLLGEAWESHYGIKPDNEKTVTRATDALAGLLRDKYFPDENRPQLGKIVHRIKERKDDFELPAESIYDKDHLFGLMRDFSKIRGNHKTGTGRAPTHEEAAFVLHYTIMLFQLLKK